MKKLIFIIFMLLAVGMTAQEVGDATITSYVNTNINTNGVGGITGAELNQALNYLIDSKVNKDSATTVRISATDDTLFITYYGFSEDTIPISSVADTSLWEVISTVLTPKSAGDVKINGGDLYPSADNTYDLGSSAYGWDSLFMSSVIEYGTSDLIFSSGAEDVRFAANGNVGIGTGADPDSLFTVNGGAAITGDILIGGGWTTWTPTIGVGTGTTPGYSNEVYRYQVVNNTVYFTIAVTITNETGGGVGDFSFTLPITPKDINAYVPVGGIYGDAAFPNPNQMYADGAGTIDCADNTPANRKLYVHAPSSIPNTDIYYITFKGFYEITSK